MNINKIPFIAFTVIISLLASCSKTESYTDLLKKEQKASNWFLAQQKVCNEIPADSVFLTGPDAPYYKMDDDGYIYMQVLKAAAPDDRDIPGSGDRVYIMYTRWNVQTMYSDNNLDIKPEDSNQNNMINLIGSKYFIFGNYSINASAEFGSGIQVPVSYLGYDSEVNILLKSYYGFATESATCVPYKVNVRYFKAEY